MEMLTEGGGLHRLSNEVWDGIVRPGAETIIQPHQSGPDMQKPQIQHCQQENTQNDHQKVGLLHHFDDNLGDNLPEF